VRVDVTREVVLIEQREVIEKILTHLDSPRWRAGYSGAPEGGDTVACDNADLMRDDRLRTGCGAAPKSKSPITLLAWAHDGPILRFSEIGQG